MYTVPFYEELEDELAGLTHGGGYEGPGRSPDRADDEQVATSPRMWLNSAAHRSPAHGLGDERAGSAAGGAEHPEALGGAAAGRWLSPRRVLVASSAMLC